MKILWLRESDPRHPKIPAKQRGILNFFAEGRGSLRSFISRLTGFFTQRASITEMALVALEKRVRQIEKLVGLLPVPQITLSPEGREPEAPASGQPTTEIVDGNLSILQRIHDVATSLDKINAQVEEQGRRLATLENRSIVTILFSRPTEIRMPPPSMN